MWEGKEFIFKDLCIEVWFYLVVEDRGEYILIWLFLSVFIKLIVCCGKYIFYWNFFIV